MVLELNSFRALGHTLEGTSIRRIFLAVSDQGVISLGNFLTGILLARHLTQSEYGTFALIIGVVISANSLHSALIGQPLTVYGAKTDAKGVGLLATGSLLMTIGISLFLNIAVFFALWSCVDPTWLSAYSEPHYFGSFRKYSVEDCYPSCGRVTP